MCGTGMCRRFRRRKSLKTKQATNRALSLRALKHVRTRCFSNLLALRDVLVEVDRDAETLAVAVRGHPRPRNRRGTVRPAYAVATLLGVVTEAGFESADRSSGERRADRLCRTFTALGGPQDPFDCGIGLATRMLRSTSS